MNSIRLRCHAELNDFLPRLQRDTIITMQCAGHESVKNVIESIGVPHPEIAALVANDTSVDFCYQVQPGDTIEAYPYSTLPDIPLVPLRPSLENPCFILDIHLGRLAAYLRILGFDTLYRNDYEDAELAIQSQQQQRVLLTRDIGLLKRRIVMFGYFVRETSPQRQLGEIFHRYQLKGNVEWFKRCIRCNGLLQSVEKAAIQHHIATRTRLSYKNFQQCQSCGHIYWQGSHYDRMVQLVERVLSSNQQCHEEGQ